MLTWIVVLSLGILIPEMDQVDRLLMSAEN